MMKNILTILLIICILVSIVGTVIFLNKYSKNPIFINSKSRGIEISANIIAALLDHIFLEMREDCRSAHTKWILTLMVHWFVLLGGTALNFMLFAGRLFVWRMPY